MFRQCSSLRSAAGCATELSRLHFKLYCGFRGGSEIMLSFPSPLPIGKVSIVPSPLSLKPVCLSHLTKQLPSALRCHRCTTAGTNSPTLLERPLYPLPLRCDLLKYGTASCDHLVISLLSPTPTGSAWCLSMDQYPTLIVCTCFKTCSCGN
jgi:hypothetical protein